MDDISLEINLNIVFIVKLKPINFILEYFL